MILVVTDILDVEVMDVAWKVGVGKVWMRYEKISPTRDIASYREDEVKPKVTSDAETGGNGWVKVGKNERKERDETDQGEERGSRGRIERRRSRGASLA